MWPITSYIESKEHKLRRDTFHRIGTVEMVSASIRRFNTAHPKEESIIKRPQGIFLKEPLQNNTSNIIIPMQLKKSNSKFFVPDSIRENDIDIEKESLNKNRIGSQY